MIKRCKLFYNNAGTLWDQTCVETLETILGDGNAIFPFGVPHD